MGNWCPKCKGFMFSRGDHKCPPLWKTNVPTFEEDEWTEVYAHTVEEAARLRAERIDAGDYDLLKGETTTVRVQTKDGIEEYEVSGEMVPTYSATWIATSKIDPSIKENDNGNIKKSTRDT